MANKKNRTPQEKARRDLMIAEIVYYSLGGLVLVTGIVFSIFGLILINPVKANFEDSALLEAQTKFFEWLKLENVDFQTAGLVLMAAAIIYFMIVLAIFAKKGDDVLKKSNQRSTRQRQIEFVAPTTDAVVTESVAEEKEETSEDKQ